MSNIITPAILIRRVDYGDYDLILTFLTRDKGKVSVLAKAAKKSVKRFGGILELFYELEIVYPEKTKKGLPVLTEASLKQSFTDIRTDIMKTAYASYWAQLLHEWAEEGGADENIFNLFRFVLKRLDQGANTPGVLSVLFQMRFLSLSGLCPNLSCCSACSSHLLETGPTPIRFDLKSGGLLCDCCAPKAQGRDCLSRGTVKLLKWIETMDIEKAERVRFSEKSVVEAEDFLEAFLPYHVGKEPKSLKFLRKIRK